MLPVAAAAASADERRKAAKASLRSTVGHVSATTQRQLPKWSEFRPLLRARPIQFNASRRRLGSALTIADLREIARRRTPRSVFDYTDGAAEAEISLRRARQTFASL